MGKEIFTEIQEMQGVPIQDKPKEEHYKINVNQID